MSNIQQYSQKSTFTSLHQNSLNMTNVREIFHLGIVSISVVIFVVATILLVKDYYSGKTGLHTHFIHDYESEFVTFTFCPMNVVKDANADPPQYYEVDDLFDTRRGIFQNKKNRVRKIFHPALGFCYALQISFPNQEGSMRAKILIIKSLQKYSVYIHESGLEYWIPFTAPIGVSITEIDASQEKVKGAQLVINEKGFAALNHIETPCSVNTNAEEFTECALNQIPNTNCSAYMKEMNGKLENICQTSDNMGEILEQGFDSMNKILNGSDKNCIRNCKSRYFSHTQTYYSEYGLRQMLKIYDVPLPVKQNSLPFVLFISKPNFWVIQEDEYVVMIFWDFLSAFGGNLGLFLGGSIVSISCFILIQMPDYFKKNSFLDYEK